VQVTVKQAAHSDSVRRPELHRGQGEKQPDAEPQQPGASKKDYREYISLEWDVNPKIQFIDRFKWNPPVVDDILKR